MMDHFFNCVASLMSGLLRRCVETSLQDLVDLVECYHDGNLYEGDYSIMEGLGLSYVIHPVTIFMVIFYFRNIVIDKDNQFRIWKFTALCTWLYKHTFFISFDVLIRNLKHKYHYLVVLFVFTYFIFRKKNLKIHFYNLSQIFLMFVIFFPWSLIPWYWVSDILLVLNINSSKV